MPRKGAARKDKKPTEIANGGASKGKRRNSKSSVSVQYSVGDNLKVKHGRGKTSKLYDAKVLRVKSPESPRGQTEYFVHFARWNPRYDEWIRQTSIVGFANDKVSSKRPKTPTNSQKMSNAKDDLSPSPGALVDGNNNVSSVEVDEEYDSTEFHVKKTRVPSLFKKNLGDDFRKSALEVMKGFSPSVDREEKVLTYLPPHLVPLQEVKKRALLHNTKSREKRLASFKAMGLKKSDTNKKIKAKAASASNPDNDVKQKFGKDHREQDEERITRPSEGAMSGSQISEDNSNTSDASAQVRSSSTLLQKSACYTKGRYFQADRRKRVSEISKKSRSTTDTDDMKESKANTPEVERATITEAKVRIAPIAAVGAVKTEMENRPVKTMRDTHGDERLKIEINKDSSNSLDKAVPSPKEANELLIENTRPTTPDQSSNNTSEDQKMNSGKHSPNIESDLPDLDDKRKDSGGCASSSGCKQISTIDNTHAETTVRDRDGSKKRSNSSSGQNRIEIRDSANNKKRGSLPSNYNNDNESEEEHDDTSRKIRRSSSKHKPKRKKSKARPKIPSAPPPFQMEELDGLTRDERIALLQARIEEMRNIYRELKQIVSQIDRKKKRKEKELKNKCTPKLTKSRDGRRKVISVDLAAFVSHSARYIYRILLRN